MNIEVAPAGRATQKTRLEHHRLSTSIPKSTVEDLQPLSQHSAGGSHLQTYGARTRHGFAKGFPYPKSQPQASRRDAWPPGGGLPASDLDFMQQQHLDFYGIEYAIMNPLSPTGQGDQNDRIQRRDGVRRQRVPARRLEPRAIRG